MFLIHWTLWPFFFIDTLYHIGLLYLLYWTYLLHIFYGLYVIGILWFLRKVFSKFPSFFGCIQDFFFSYPNVSFFRKIDIWHVEASIIHNTRLPSYLWYQNLDLPVRNQVSLTQKEPLEFVFWLADWVLEQVFDIALGPYEES